MRAKGVSIGGSSNWVPFFLRYYTNRKSNRHCLVEQLRGRYRYFSLRQGINPRYIHLLRMRHHHQYLLRDFLRPRDPGPTSWRRWTKYLAQQVWPPQIPSASTALKARLGSLPWSGLRAIPARKRRSSPPHTMKRLLRLRPRPLKLTPIPHSNFASSKEVLSDPFI